MTDEERADLVKGLENELEEAMVLVGMAQAFCGRCWICGNAGPSFDRRHEKGCRVAALLERYERRVLAKERE